jgi:hypothetical protein
VTSADEKVVQAENRAQDLLASTLGRIMTKAKATRSTGFTIPELDEDPDSTDPTNLWLLADGRLRARTFDGTVREYAQEAPAGSSTSGTLLPDNPTPAGYRTIYPATWGESYCSVHGVESGTNLEYGTASGTSHGDYRIMLGLDYATIQADLVGATITGVDFTLENTDSWATADVEIFMGAHAEATAPAIYTPTRLYAFQDPWPRYGRGAYWRSASTWFGSALRDGDILGITIEPPSTSNGQHGECRWASFSIAISYSK